MSERRYIVFCGEHYNPLGIIRSLGEAGLKVTAIVKKNKFRLTSKSKYIETLYLIEDIEEGLKILLDKFGGEILSPIIFTADDRITELLDKNYNILADKFIFFNASEANRIKYFMNKDNINKIAIKHGLNVLPNIVVNNGDIPVGLEYPVITKPISSSEGAWKKDMYICNSEAELVKSYEAILSKKMLLQKYIQKRNELCIEGMSVAHGKEVFLSIASTYNYLLKNGYSPYMTVNNFNNPSLYTQIKNIIEEIRFEGIFEVEFLIGEDHKLYFCEINFRNSTWSYASTCAGMNLPFMWSQAMLTSDMKLVKQKTIPENFYAMVEIDDFINRVANRKISVFKWFKQMICCKCRYYLGNFDDLMPIVSMITYKLKKILKKGE